MTEPHLLLIDELALLALREENGRSLIGKMELDCGFAGAILAELQLSGRIALVDGVVVVADPAPTGHEGIDAELARIVERPQLEKPASWVRIFQAGHPRTEVLTSLAEQGLVKEQNTKLLGLFPIRRYPQVSRVPEAEIRDRLDAVLRDGTGSDRDIALLSLVVGCGLGRKLFNGPDKSIARQIAKGHWIGLAVRSVIDMSYTEVAAG